MAVRAAVLVLSVLSVVAHPTDGHHIERRSIANGAWFQARDHPVAKLFVRQDGPAVGTPAWLNQYPPTNGAPSQAEADIPPLWLAAYNAAKAAGKIPNIPIAVQTGGLPTYGSTNLMDPTICSSAGKCKAEGDIWDAPDGRIGLNFDDGPWLGTTKLLNFLDGVNQTATMYLIGRNVLQWPQQTIRAFEAGHELACHTWSHPKMTSETDYGILVELGWTLQIIHDLTDGRVPKFWRPPTGDMDNRVRAIAREVFGLTPVLWNYDTEDWSLNSPTPVYGAQHTSELLAQWLAGPKHPGLIILQHELTDDTVELFINSTWPGIQSNHWRPSPIAALFNLPYYQNAANNDGAVTPKTNMALDLSAPPPSPTGSATSIPGTQSSGLPRTQSGGAKTTSAPIQGSTKPPGDGAGHHAASLFCAVAAAVIAMYLA
jgi:peptidoglycan/xylan/chitin deacetylase (PgdA/CDA1 family)